MNDELPTCPFCDTTLKPERIMAQRFVCPCCAREWLDGPPPPKKP